MIVLIIMSIILNIAFIINNTSIILSIVCTISTFTFLLRPFGIQVKWYELPKKEWLFFFLVYILSLFSRHFSLLSFLISIGLRLLQYLIVYYDDTNYIYYEVEEEKEV